MFRSASRFHAGGRGATGERPLCASNTHSIPYTHKGSASLDKFAIQEAVARSQVGTVSDLLTPPENVLLILLYSFS